MTGKKDLLGRLSELRTYLQLADAERLAASWALQTREERKRRLHAVMHLSIELVRIQETTEFSTRLAESAIESVIEGDWKMVEEWAEHFTFDDEGAQLRERFAPVFAVFRELLLQTLRATKGLA